MSGELPFAAKIVSPLKCNEKPWDMWVSEIGHLSPLRDDEAEVKGGASGRGHPYKERPRPRRAGVNRLNVDTMSLHGLFPQMDNLNAAVCHMCGVIVKCSAAYKHLLESHTETEPILPPPAAPTVKLKVLNRSRHKKDSAQPALPVDLLPLKMETSPVHTATAPLSRLMLPPKDVFLDEASTSGSIGGEVQVCVESGELPVVSIQDTEDLRLGDNLTDDIFAIMNSEGIQSADDITNAADWKNIIRDIGNMQEINFSQTTDSQSSQDMYAPVDTSSLSAYTIADTDLSSIQFPNTSPMLSSVIDNNVLNVNQALKPATSHTSSTPSSKSHSRSKTSKTKFNLREYDPNKHCGVVTAENPKPCTRSLTCKAHALSLRRTVEGRSKPFDTLLAEHRASRDANSTASAAPVQTPAPQPPPAAPLNLPPLLVNTSIDLSAFNGLTAEQQVNDIYATLLSVEDPNSVLPDTSTLTSLLSQPLPTDLLLPDDAEIPPEVPILSIASPVEAATATLDERTDEGPPTMVPSEVCWYSSCPRPLALCTYNTSHAGCAITLGKKFATVRSNIKSSLTRSCKATGTGNSYYYGQNALSLSKTVHMNASKTNKPEVRKLIVTCSANANGNKVQPTLGELFGGDVRHTHVNGHLHSGGERKRSPLKHTKHSPSTVLDLGFSLDPLLADEKC